MTALVIETASGDTGRESKCTKDAQMPNLTEKYSNMINNVDLAETLHSSFGMHEWFSKNKSNTHNRHPLLPKRFKVFGPGGCRYSNKGVQILERSTCPWRIMLTVDKDRFPEKMFTAECVCSNCKGRSRSKFNCEKILFPMKVLRQKYRTKTNEKVCEKVNGVVTYKFEEFDEPIATGCTCTRTERVIKSKSRHSIKSP